METEHHTPHTNGRKPRKQVSLDSGRAAFRVSELDQILPLHRATIGELVKEGVIRSVTIGSVRVVPRAEIDRLLALVD